LLKRGNVRIEKHHLTPVTTSHAGCHTYRIIHSHDRGSLARDAGVFDPKGTVFRGDFGM